MMEILIPVALVMAALVGWFFGRTPMDMTDSDGVKAHNKRAAELKAEAADAEQDAEVAS